MAKRIPVPKDNDRVIAARMRTTGQLNDCTIILGKINGVWVQYVPGGKHITWKHPIPDEVDKKIKDNALALYAFKWVQFSDRRLAEVQNPASQWYPVSKKANEVYAPYAYGDQNDDKIHLGGDILCKRDIEFDNMVRADQRMANDPERYLEQSSEIATDQLRSMGAAEVTQGFDSVSKDAVTRNTGDS